MIDLYRFLLASTVVVFHSGFGGGGGVYALYGFYIISGYLIYRVCDRVYFNKDFRLITFYFNRFLRLIPHFIISSFLIYFVFFNSCKYFSFASCLALPTNVTLYINDFYSLSINDFLSGTLPDFRIKIDPPQFVGFFGYVSAFWSVTIEIFFYLIVPFIFLICNKSDKNFKYLLIITFLIYLLFSFILTPIRSPGIWSDIVYRNVFPCLFFFSLGILSYKYKKNLHDFFSRYIPEKYLLIYMFASIFLILFGSKYFNTSLPVLEYQIWLLVVSFGSLLAIIYDQGADNKAYKFLGSLSYPIYLNHKLIIILFIAYKHLIERDSLYTSTFIDYFLIFFFSIFISIFTYFLIEIPLDKIRTFVRRAKL